MATEDVMPLSSLNTLNPDTPRRPQPEMPVTTRRGTLPLLPGFVPEILPVLVIWWVVMLVLFFTLKVYYLDIALVGTPTIVMLWPVGHSERRSYLTYRRPAWIIGIVTMWIIPATGLVFTESHAGFEARSALFFALPAVIAFGGILVSLPWAMAKQPIRMFFRPDLLFGDGRTLVGGTLLLVLGLRYLFAPHPPDVPWALPQWDWFSLAFGISGGIIPIVLMRGMMKLVQRHMRLRDGLFAGYASIAFRDGLLLLFGLMFGFAFHHVFMGRPVFTTVADLSVFPITRRFWAGIALMLAAAIWIVFVKGGVRRLIGEPFFFETFAQTLQKQLVFTAAWGVFFYGYMSMLSSKMFGQLQPWDAQSKAGVGFLAGGIVVLTVGRSLGQYYQRRAMLAHFAAVMIPSQVDKARERMTRRVLEGLAASSTHAQEAAWETMHRAWDGVDREERSLAAWTTVNVLATLPAPARKRLIAAESRALTRLDSAARQRASAEIASAMSALDEDRRAQIVNDLAPVFA